VSLALGLQRKRVIVSNPPSKNRTGQAKRLPYADRQ